MARSNKPNPNQLDLFAASSPDPAPTRNGPAPAPTAPGDVEVADRLPDNVWLGTSSWSFPGWKGIVYAERHSQSLLSRDGLTAYCRHPLLRAVGMDRTHYAPLPAGELQRHAEQVPRSFRFLMKAHEWCTLARFPEHPRYGARRGAENPHFLDADYAIAEVIEPAVAGLGDKLGAILFQVAPQSFRDVGGDRAFLDRLHRFLSRLPPGPRYAVELRNPTLLTGDYTAALRDTGALHCLNALGGMPRLTEQWQRAEARDGGALLIRWMLHPSLDYGGAVTRYQPFDRLVDEDVSTRTSIARLVAAAAQSGQPAFVIINNKAEGSSPLSVFRLAHAIADELNTPSE